MEGDGISKQRDVTVQNVRTKPTPIKRGNYS
jgi:hypothetical protein